MIANELGLPHGLVVKGAIPQGQSRVELVGDMVEIDLPDGTTVEVGWTPEHDPDGHYRIVVFREYWSNQVEAPLFTKDRSALIGALQRIVAARIAPRLETAATNTSIVLQEQKATDG